MELWLKFDDTTKGEGAQAVREMVCNTGVVGVDKEPADAEKFKDMASFNKRIAQVSKTVAEAEKLHFVKKAVKEKV